MSGFGSQKQTPAKSAHTRALAVLAGLLLTLTAAPAFAQTADTVLFNGKILTVDGDFSVREALAIGHGEVLATGVTAQGQYTANTYTFSASSLTLFLNN